MNPSVQGLRVDLSLDVRGTEGPDGFQKARSTLAQMQEQQILELYVDEGEVLRTLPFGLRADGHEILISEPASKGVRMLIRKQSLLP